MRINRVKFIAEMARQDLTVLDLAKNCCLSRATITGVRSGKSCTQETLNFLSFLTLNANCSHHLSPSGSS